jgi:hypothetical protein
MLTDAVDTILINDNDYSQSANGTISQNDTDRRVAAIMATSFIVGCVQVNKQLYLYNPLS